MFCLFVFQLEDAEVWVSKGQVSWSERQQLGFEPGEADAMVDAGNLRTQLISDFSAV